MAQTDDKKVKHRAYGVAFALSYEAKDSNPYEDVGARMMKELPFSAQQTEKALAKQRRAAAARKVKDT